MPYFTTAELRALPDLSSIERFPDARLTAAHDWIVAIIERECETSFVVTTVTDEVRTGGGCNSLRLSNPYVRSVTEVTVDGVDYDAPQVAAIVIEDGYLYQPDGGTWSTASRGNISVTYTAGYTTVPPADLKGAALQAARNWLLVNDAWSGKDARTTSITNEYGNIQLSVAGPDRPTGLPDVDSTIMAWARKVRVPKVA